MIPSLDENPQFWLLNAPFFILLLSLSISSISLVIEKCLLLGRWRCRSRRLPAQISLLLKGGQLQKLGYLLLPERGPEAILLRKGFHFIKQDIYGPNGHRPPQILTTEEPLFAVPKSLTLPQVRRLEQWLENCIEELGLQLEKHCNLFHLIANVATLLGLLGTVTGMIYAFQSGALEQSMQLAQGISQALITTAGGLIVAIPAIVSQQLFLHSSGLRIFALDQLKHDILLFMHQHLSSQQFTATHTPLAPVNGPNGANRSNVSHGGTHGRPNGPPRARKNAKPTLVPNSKQRKSPPDRQRVSPEHRTSGASVTETIATAKKVRPAATSARQANAGQMAKRDTIDQVGAFLGPSAKDTENHRNNNSSANLGELQLAELQPDRANDRSAKNQLYFGSGPSRNKNA